MNQQSTDSIFWIEIEKIKPNPYQPRKEFDKLKLESLADSIKQYGILQPLVATRREYEKEDGGLGVEYELIAGERRLRASKLANLVQVPVLIRSGEDDDELKLELAIIENLQREDLSSVDRAKAFQQLVNEFGFKHIEVAKKIGKSREYVSNTLRILTLPEEILKGLTEGNISEGHTRPLLMLSDRPEEQITLFKEIVHNRLTVRDAESISRRVAYDKIRKKDRFIEPELVDMEEKLTEELGTRVQIDRREVGGKITIDFFSDEDLKEILSLIKKRDRSSVSEVRTEENIGVETIKEDSVYNLISENNVTPEITEINEVVSEEESDDIYSVNNFSL